MKPVFARAANDIVIVDGHARVVVSETQKGSVYLHVTRGTYPAPGLRPDDVAGAHRLVELYYASRGHSGPESPEPLRWAQLAVRANFRLSGTGEWKFVLGECHTFAIPEDAVVDWYGVLPEAPDHYTVFAWYSPATRTNVLYYMPDAMLEKPPAHVVVRAMLDPEPLWDRVREHVEEVFRVETLCLDSRLGPIKEIYRWHQKLLEKRGRVVRIGCTTARVVPVTEWLADEANQLLDRWGYEYKDIVYVGAYGKVIARRRGVYVGDLID